MRSAKVFSQVECLALEHEERSSSEEHNAVDRTESRKLGSFIETARAVVLFVKCTAETINLLLGSQYDQLRRDN